MHILKLALPSASLDVAGKALPHKGSRTSEANDTVAPVATSRIKAGQVARLFNEVGRDVAGGTAAAGAGTATESLKCKLIAA
jgi:hypothetical protein